MEMPDAERIFRYWQKHPPPHELLAAWVGFKGSDASDATMLPRDDPSVRLGVSILAGIDAARATQPPSNTNMTAGMPQMFPGGSIRI